MLLESLEQFLIRQLHALACWCLLSVVKSYVHFSTYLASDRDGRQTQSLAPASFGRSRLGGYDLSCFSCLSQNEGTDRILLLLETLPVLLPSVDDAFHHLLVLPCGRVRSIEVVVLGLKPQFRVLKPLDEVLCLVVGI